MLSVLAERILRAADDLELKRLSPGLVFVFEICCEDEVYAFEITEGRLRELQGAQQFDARLIFAPETLSLALAQPPAPRHNSFTALQIASAGLVVTGEGVSQARAAIERVFEIALAAPPVQVAERQRDLTQIEGRYLSIERDVFYTDRVVRPDRAALVFLHTAGADARQFQDVMSDVALQNHFDMFAPDLPFHGRSLPPQTWGGESYSLEAGRYQNWICQFLEEAVGRRAILAGCSMGAAVALQVAARRSDLVAGVIAIEPPFQAKGRIAAAQHDVNVHAGLHNPAWVRGLMSPLSPAEHRRRAAWIYSQAAPQIYQEDLRYYTTGFDGAVTGPQVAEAQVPVVIMSGAYDYSGSPEDGAKLLKLIPNASQIIMPELGHFPMTEHPDLFTPYFETALARLGRAQAR